MECLQDLADKDDLIGTRIIPLKKFVKKDKEQRIDLLDAKGKLVKGKDGKPTTIFLRLKGTRAVKSGTLLTVPGLSFSATCITLSLRIRTRACLPTRTHALNAGMNPNIYALSLEELCEGLAAETWEMDVTLISAERLPKKMQPSVELSLVDSRSGKQVSVSCGSLSHVALCLTWLSVSLCAYVACVRACVRARLCVYILATICDCSHQITTTIIHPTHALTVCVCVSMCVCVSVCVV